MQKVLLIIAHSGFKLVEYMTSKKILIDAGIKVVTASNLLGTAISSITDDEAKVDLVLDDVNVADYDGIFFIGGPGALENLNNEKSYRIIREVASSGKVWGAICISPRILAAAGVLKNKKVTGWDRDNELAGILSAARAEYVREAMVVDGNLITGNGPEAAAEWGTAIARALS
ncbi:MAG: DJ-1/PfpI family protein [Patescibacteria group bacterium]